MTLIAYCAKLKGSENSQPDLKKKSQCVGKGHTERVVHDTKKAVAVNNDSSGDALSEHNSHYHIFSLAQQKVLFLYHICWGVKWVLVSCVF